eukprot:1123686-Rhodomonas_salina.1
MSSIPSGPAISTTADAVGSRSWMNSRTDLNYINLPERGLCVAAVDVCCALTDKSRHSGQRW